MKKKKVTPKKQEKIEGKKNVVIADALKPRTKDKRDISHTRLYGAQPLSEIPSGDFFVGDPLEIKNQDINYQSDYCASYAAAEVREDQRGITFVPEYTFAKARQLLNDVEEYGLELRDVCMAAIKFGFLERQYDPFHCDTVDRPDRNHIANWKNWSEELDMLAWEHAPNSFVDVDGPYDTFDNFRAFLWKNKMNSRSIITGVKWRGSWTYAEGGYIDTNTYDPNEKGSGHALKIFGQMQAKGKIWLVAQLSNGSEVGDKGIFYFSREVINLEFTPFGAYAFSDAKKEYAQYHHAIGAKIDASIFAKAFKLLWYGIKSLFTKQK